MLWNILHLTFVDLRIRHFMKCRPIKESCSCLWNSSVQTATFVWKFYFFKVSISHCVTFSNFNIRHFKRRPTRWPTRWVRTDVLLCQCIMLSHWLRHTQGRGKWTAWDRSAYDEVTPAFGALAATSETVDNWLCPLEQLLVLLHDGTSSQGPVSWSVLKTS